MLQRRNFPKLYRSCTGTVRELYNSIRRCLLWVVSATLFEKWCARSLKLTKNKSTTNQCVRMRANVPNNNNFPLPPIGHYEQCTAGRRLPHLRLGQPRTVGLWLGLLSNILGPCWLKFLFLAYLFWRVRFGIQSVFSAPTMTNTVSLKIVPNSAVVSWRVYIARKVVTVWSVKGT